MMASDLLLKLLADVRSGAVTSEQATADISSQRYEDIGFAKIDHDRTERCGMPEVIFGQGKTPQQVAEIFQRLQKRGSNVLATRVSKEAAASIMALVPEAKVHTLARCVTLWQSNAPINGKIGVVCAGTSDLPVAEEAAITAELFGSEVTRICDVGVAGLHRLLAHIDTLRAMHVLVVCAGMEGALPSVVAGLVRVPVLAVPTSIGYGASFGGVTALLGMLNSCSPNVSVVNIDNGFGAGYQATLIARQAGA